jgi:hypothetical protein
MSGAAIIHDTHEIGHSSRCPPQRASQDNEQPRTEYWSVRYLPKTGGLFVKPLFIFCSFRPKSNCFIEKSIKKQKNLEFDRSGGIINRK